MPDTAARDPHTPLFDPNGMLWFTVQQGNFIGKLDPKTGKVTLKQSPTPRSNPYGLRMDSKGTPWYCEFGSNKIAHVDPATMEIKEYILPEGARPRRFTIAANDVIYYSDHQRGYLGRLDPKTGKIEEWPSPGGPASRSYAITTLPDGTIWYSESNVTPNTIVRFDPKDNSFMKWPIPSGGNVLRHFVPNREGNKIYIASSGANKVGVVEISKR
jgi:virginiamycin B lyase